jgi:CBS domain-containing protein
MIPPREFIRKIRPFSFLSDDELDIMVSSLEVILLERGKVIYKKGQHTEYVYVISSGLVGLFDDETVVDYLSRGEIFGVLLLYGFPSSFIAKALEDTVCYVIATGTFKLVMDQNERFAAFFTTFINRRFKSFMSIASDKKILEEAAFVLEIAKIIYKEPVVCKSDATIVEAASNMERHGVSSIVVIDDNRKPIGILTHKDLAKVIIRGEKSDRVAAFMSAPVKTTSVTATIFDAFTKMTDVGIDHLVVVTKEDLIYGVVTRKDIQVHLEPSFSIVKLFRRITRATAIEELETLCGTLRLSVAKISMTGPAFYDLTKMICSVHDAIVAKTIELLAGVPARDRFAWVHMGSSGRKEEIIATDQDNALICREQVPAALAVNVSESLARLGFPKCPGDYMASNERWSQTLPVWQGYFQQWFADPIPDHVRYLSVFLDMRPVYGETALYDALVEAIRPVVTAAAVRLLAYDAVELEPPLGISGILRLHKGVDLKIYGIYPIVNGARVLALDSGMLEITNTRERLEALNKNGIISDDLSHGLLEAYGFLQDLRLRHHARAVLSQTPVHNRVSAKELSKIDLLILKESLKIVASFQRFLMKKYDVQRTVIYSQL